MLANTCQNNATKQCNIQRLPNGNRHETHNGVRECDKPRLPFLATKQHGMKVRAAEFAMFVKKIIPNQRSECAHQRIDRVF